MNTEDVQSKIHEIFGNISNNFNILEDQIDISLQMEYFELSKSHKKKLKSAEILASKDDIFREDVSDEDKKILLTRLASLDDVTAYRTIEQFVNKTDSKIRDWGILALQESRMMLESTLLDENQVFISTGLGGKGQKLRYFVVLTSKNNKPFNDLQKRIIRSEFEFNLDKHNAELEELEYAEFFATFLTLIPLDLDIKLVLRDAVNECNLFGDFLTTNFIVTNVKKLSIPEIKKFLEESDKEDESDNNVNYQ